MDYFKVTSCEKIALTLNPYSTLIFLCHTYFLGLKYGFLSAFF